MELRGGKTQTRISVFFNLFLLPRGHTEGKARRKTTILVWIELCRKMCLLISPHAKTKTKKNPKTHLELCTDSILYELSVFHV